MDSVAGAFHLAGATLDLAVVDADLHEGRGRDLGPMHPERNLIVAVAAARHDQGQVVEDPLAETLHEGQPVRSRKIDARLPFLGAVIPERFRRNPELHRHPPNVVCPSAEAWRPYTHIVAQFETAVAENCSGPPISICDAGPPSKERLPRPRQ